MSSFKFEDKSIYYKIKSFQSSRAIIFIHGSGGTSHTWVNQFELGIDSDLIFIDLPSQGKSSKLTNLSLDIYVQVIDKLIENLDYSELILCGHSLGGAIIQDYYYKHSENVSKLILVGTGAKLRVSPTIFKSLTTDYEWFLNSLPIGAFSRRTPKSIINNYMLETSEVGPEVTFQDFSICDKFDTMNKTSTIKVKCLIIVGKEDKLTPVKYSLFFKENINNSELVIINNAGHMVMLEQPVDFNNAIKNFV